MKELNMKHWKNMLLALTGFFWNSCDYSSTATGADSPLTTSLKNDSKASSDPVQASAPNLAKTGFSDSVAFDVIVPLYGIPIKYCLQEEGSRILTCSDGLTCIETVVETPTNNCTGTICPKYGVFFSKKKMYTCDNNRIYTEDEFRSLYRIRAVPKKKKIICHKVARNVLECEDGKTFTMLPINGFSKVNYQRMVFINDDQRLSAEEFLSKYEIAD